MLFIHLLLAFIHLLAHAFMIYFLTFFSFVYFCFPPECGTVNACKEGCGSSETQSRLVSITAVNPAVSFLTSPCFPPLMPTAHLSDPSQNALLFDSITAHCLFTSFFKAVIPNCFCLEAHQGSSTFSLYYTFFFFFFLQWKYNHCAGYHLVLWLLFCVLLSKLNYKICFRIILVFWQL